MANDWSREEVEATISDYFDMLAKELRQQGYNKAEHNRNLQKLLNSRTKGAIEKKHQNISAVLIELGYPYIDGYKPLPNYQQLLRVTVEDRLLRTDELDKAAAANVQYPVEHIPSAESLLVVTPSPREEKKPKLYDKPVQLRRMVRKNFLEIESRNQALGIAGEKLVLEFEHRRLWQAGKRDLANRIQHVSQTEGDGLGFDILSYENDGRERLVEVKTTRFGESTPFFASKNEVDVSAMRDKEYQLYRLFKFGEQPKLYILPGSLRSTCSLDPVQFTALPR